MALETLLDISARLPIVALRCSIKMGNDGALDDHAGSLFHGAFGWALREAAPRLWSSAYGPQAQGAIRPFAIVPPRPCQWRKGEELQFELTLFAELAKDVAGVLAALQTMGSRGLGTQRTPFSLQQLVQLCPEGQQLIWSSYCQTVHASPQTVTLDQTIISAAPLWSALPAQRLVVQITCRSRLHIKEQGQVLTQAPSAITLARSISRRLLTLTDTTGEHEKQRLYANLNGLNDVRLAWDHSQERELRRFSSRSRQQHHIEGLSGCWGYQGSGLVYLLPWLALGKWLHLGSKTTFGFGAFDWQVGMTS